MRTIESIAMNELVTFMVICESDPTAGGGIQKLEKQGIKIFVMPAKEAPPGEIPSWVPPSDVASVRYYFRVARSDLEETILLCRRFNIPDAIIKPD
jgi:hypothetical protein